MESVGADGSWPPPFGIIKTPYKEWIQRSVDAQHDVAVLKVRRIVYTLLLDVFKLTLVSCS